MSQRMVRCRQCGTYERRGGKAQRSKLCAECGMAKSTGTQWDMHHHRGKAWDNYVASGQVLGRVDQIRGPAGRYLPRAAQEQQPG